MAPLVIGILVDWTGGFTAAGYFMAALGILKIPWSVWARWLLPLLAIWLVLGSIAVLVAHAIHLGPF